MNEEFEKILERLDKEEKLAYKDMMIAKRVNVANYHSGEKDAYRISRKIVQEVEEEYNGGWIACSDRLPEESLNSVIGWDEYRQRCCFVQYYCGRWILGNDIDSVKIIAWQPLPEPFKSS